MLTKKQKDFAAEAIDIGGSTDMHAVRVRNFIHINYGENISMAQAERIWKRHEKRKEERKGREGKGSGVNETNQIN